VAGKGTVVKGAAVPESVIEKGGGNNKESLKKKTTNEGKRSSVSTLENPKFTGGRFDGRKPKREGHFKSHQHVGEKVLLSRIKSYQN